MNRPLTSLLLGRTRHECLHNAGRVRHHAGHVARVLRQENSGRLLAEVPQRGEILGGKLDLRDA
jgi:hypothetical protein